MSDVEEKDSLTDLSSIFGGSVEEEEDETPPEELDVKDEDKKEEEKEDEKPDEVNWQKRHADTLKSMQETREENKALKTQAEQLAKETAELKTLTKKLNRELFPDEDEDEDKKPDEKVVEPEGDKWKGRVAEAEALTRSVYKDYDEKVGKEGDKEAPFAKAVADSPALWNRVRSAVNPALEAYNIAKEYEFRTTYGSTPEEIREKIRAEVLKEMEEAPRGEKTTKTKRPTTLRDVESAAADKGMGEDKGAPLSAIFGGR